MSPILRKSLVYVAIAWPVMMVLVYLWSLMGGFAGTNLFVFGALMLPGLFLAGLASNAIAARGQR